MGGEAALFCIGHLAGEDGLEMGFGHAGAI
jgi:hypothetical protein